MTLRVYSQVLQEEYKRKYFGKLTTLKRWMNFLKNRRPLFWFTILNIILNMTVKIDVKSDAENQANIDSQFSRVLRRRQ